MRGLLARTLEALLVGAATVAGVKLAYELADPYSAVRLRASELVDRLPGR